MRLDNKKYRVIGVMSGTSLDGIDIAACDFEYCHKSWKYRIVKAKTYEYSLAMRTSLAQSQHLNGLDLAYLDVAYGRLIGEKVNDFIDEFKLLPDFIASHGYTVFHEPHKGLTLQIGSGAEIAALTKIKTICNFRVGDVARGGQGAPLVPIGDALLFSEFTACLNLGGFANISFPSDNGGRIAYDICPVNFVLNRFAQKAGYEFDINGDIGRKGMVHDDLLLKLNALDFYKKAAPKSLGREFVEKEIYPLLHHIIPIEDVMATFYKHIAIQISNEINNKSNGRVLVTGGGAKNTFLIEQITAFSKLELVIPDMKIVDFKEALIFAFLGVLRFIEQPNCLASVTGASTDNIGGAVFL